MKPDHTSDNLADVFGELSNTLKQLHESLDSLGLSVNEIVEYAQWRKDMDIDDESKILPLPKVRKDSTVEEDWLAYIEDGLPWAE